MASPSPALTWRRLLLALLALWVAAAIASAALTYLGHSHSVVRGPVQHRSVGH